MMRDDVPSGAVGHHVFDTELGMCGVAWDASGRITAVALPAADAEETVARLARVGSTAALPPHRPAVAVDRIVALLRGDDVGVDDIELAMDSLPDFDRRVYAVTSAIPRGSTLTYGAVAARLGSPGAAQAVGRSLGRNPLPILVPCHRILGAGTEIGGFSAPGGVATKRAILALEGVAGFGEPTLF
ncbi:methylated-DNA--[protein]-cysteine S-methyltransferase [Williamsia sp. SKLECPSW1]